MKKSRLLWNGFLESVSSYPDRPAVFAEGSFITYSDLAETAQRIAATIQNHLPSSKPPLTAVFAYRSHAAFVGVLGSLLSGHGYVPLNRTFPLERTRIMIERSGCRSVIVDKDSAPQINTIIDGIRKKLLLIFIDIENVEELAKRWPQHLVFGSGDLDSYDSWHEPLISDEEIAYLLFTSGSTGIPKGVMVSHRNVISFIDYLTERYEITENDRLSQMFDMSFDLSVFDMFVSWEKGACVCCPSQKTLIKPGKFIQDMELTVWFSVPSTVVFMKRLGMLKPNRYPSLKWSLFCGEALPVDSIQAWSQAAPNSKLENLYGPTELTIACTHYRWNPNKSHRECEMGIVPIGYPYSKMKVLILDEKLNEVADGSVGELLMNGPQLTPGYWKDPEKTSTTFVAPPGKKEIFYRTGDRVRKPKGRSPMTYLGRVDFQVQIHGHRVELGEIEEIVRKASGYDGVVAIGWPFIHSGCDGIEVFIEGKRIDGKDLHDSIELYLPDYMRPKKFHFINKLPLNVNGKFDRKALINILEESK